MYGLCWLLEESDPWVRCENESAAPSVLPSPRPRLVYIVGRVTQHYQFLFTYSLAYACVMKKSNAVTGLNCIILVTPTSEAVPSKKVRHWRCMRGNYGILLFSVRRHKILLKKRDMEYVGYPGHVNTSGRVGMEGILSHLRTCGSREGMARLLSWEKSCVPLCCGIFLVHCVIIALDFIISSY